MHWIERFGSVTLPAAKPNHYVGVGKLAGRFLPLAAGGVFDPQGSEQASLQGTMVTWRGAAVSQAEFLALRAMFGKRDKLLRQVDGGSWEWAHARLVGIDGQRAVENQRYVELSADFQQISAVWNGERHGNGWLLDAGEYLDTGLELDEESGDIYTLYGATTNVVINNGGNAVVRNAIMRIIPGTDAITAVTISKSGQTEITYTGTINPSQVLEIDCGAWSVKNNSVDDYDGLTYGSGHVIDGLLRLDPGDNPITIVKTGGNIDDRIELEFYDGWQ